MPYGVDFGFKGGCHQEKELKGRTRARAIPFPTWHIGHKPVPCPGAPVLWRMEGHKFVMRMALSRTEGAQVLAGKG